MARADVLLPRIVTPRGGGRQPWTYIVLEHRHVLFGVDLLADINVQWHFLPIVRHQSKDHDGLGIFVPHHRGDLKIF